MKALQTLGKYELLEKIGAGGMAEVYKARLTGVEGFQKIVVVKKILPGYARNLSFIKMLIEEAKLTSVLQHPNIVSIFELDSVDQQYYIAMEFVDGRDLLKILARCAERKIRVPVDLACYIISEVCSGLHYAHRAKDIYGNPLNIIHRDVSPSNVIVSWDGHVKIMDFGVAKARTEDSKGSKNVLRGKLGYMSPEQVKGEDIDRRSDLFSLGIVLFETLTLKRLFLGRTDLETLINVRDANIEKKFKKYPFLDEPLKDLLRKALSRDRETRFSTALEFQNALNDYLFQKKQRLDPSKISQFLDSVFDKASGDEDNLMPRPRKVAGPGEDSEIELDAPSTIVGRPEEKSEPSIEELSRQLQEASRMNAADPKTDAGTVTPRSGTAQKRPKVPREEYSTEYSYTLKEESSASIAVFGSKESSPRVGQEPEAISASLDGQNFRLRNTSGYVFGPVDYSNLVNLVQTGAVSEEEFVSIDGGEWLRVRELTTVRSLSPNEALRTKGITPIYSGSTSKSGIVRVFYQIASRQLSGKLRFVQGSAQKEFYFYKGKPKHVASNLKQELLGPFLLHRGIVDENQMKSALGKAAEFGGRLGDALVSMGFVKPHELYWLLDLQFREKFLQIFKWDGGTYEFYEGVPCPVEMAPSDVDVYRYIVEGVRKHVAASDLKSFFAPHENSLIRPRKNSYLTMEKLPLNSKDQRMWAQVQRSRTIATALRDAVGNEEGKNTLYQLMLILYQLELIAFQPRK